MMLVVVVIWIACGEDVVDDGVDGDGDVVDNGDAAYDNNCKYADGDDDGDK